MGKDFVQMKLKPSFWEASNTERKHPLTSATSIQIQKQTTYSSMKLIRSWKYSEILYSTADSSLWAVNSTSIYLSSIGVPPMELHLTIPTELIKLTRGITVFYNY